MWPGALKNENHSLAGKVLDEEDPTEAETGTRKEQGLSKAVRGKPPMAFGGVRQAGPGIQRQLWSLGKR